MARRVAASPNVTGAGFTQSIWVEGAVITPSIGYQCVLSGVGPKGDCYFAITNVETGRSEIAKIPMGEPNELGVQRHFAGDAFEKGREGRLVFTPDLRQDLDATIRRSREQMRLSTR